MLRGTIIGSFATGFLGAFVVGFVLYDTIAPSYLLIWMIMHFIVFFMRISFTKKLLRDLKTDTQILKRKLIFSLILTASGAILYAIIIWIAVFYQASDIDIMLVSTAIVVLAAGSISTLGSVFHAFVLFILLTIIPLIGALLYINSEIFNIISFMLGAFMFVHIGAGYRYYITLRNAVSLKESFETIFNQSPDGIILIKKQRFKECNDSIVSMFKYDTKEHFLSSNLKKITPEYQPDGHSSTQKMILMLKKAWEEKKNSYELLHVKADGELFWCEIVLTRIYLDGEDLIHGVWRDISDRKKAELQLESLNSSLEKRVQSEIEKNRLSDQKLLQHSKMAQMGEMISMIAHQWRQPLSAISTTAVNLKLKLELESFNLNEKKSAYACNNYFLQRLKSIEEYTQNLSLTIDDFRNFYRPDKRSVNTQLEEIIQKSLNIIRASLVNDNINIIEKYHSTQAYELYDGEMMQVILNLLKNAQDNFQEKTIKHPYIKITTHSNSLSICDNGGGIPQSIITKIFEPYFSTKSEKNGTGLGLYMSKIIVEEHHKGSLHVTNTDEGVCFEITLKGIQDEQY